MKKEKGQIDVWTFKMTDQKTDQTPGVTYKSNQKPKSNSSRKPTRYQTWPIKGLEKTWKNRIHYISVYFIKCFEKNILYRLNKLTIFL